MDWIDVLTFLVAQASSYAGMFGLALWLSVIHAWATFHWRWFYGWKRFVIKNLILKEFRLGIIPETLIMFIGALFIHYNFVLVEVSLLALLYILSGIITLRTGRLNLPVV